MRIPRTDLAMETFDASEELPGVSVSHWDAADVRMTEVVIKDPHTAVQLGKPCGVYLTMECPLLREQDPDARIAISTLLGEELARMIPQDEKSPVLVIGLGNRFITPESLGPSTAPSSPATCSARASRLRTCAASAPSLPACWA